MALPVGTGLLLSGCSLNRVGREEVSTALRTYLERGPATAERYARTPVIQEPSERPQGDEGKLRKRKQESGEKESGEKEPGEKAAPAQLFESPRTLRAFLLVALKNNPDVKAAEDIARAKAERIPQVTALPDPVLASKTLPEPVRTAEGDNFFILGVSQKLPVPQKLDSAGRIALEETRIALQRLEETRLRVIAEVKRAYFQLYILDKSIDITAENRDLLQGLIDVARAQVAAGRRSQDDVLRAQVELSNLEAELIDLRQRRATVVARVNELLDRAPTTPIATPEDFEVRRADVSVKDLFAKAVRANPSIARLHRQIERDRHAVELAKLAYWPDFSIGFEWIQMDARGPFKPDRSFKTGLRPRFSRLSEDGSDNWAITFGFTLPIWYAKIKAGIEESARTLSASQRQYASVRNRVYFQVEDALERIRAQRDLADIFRDTIIPQARQTYLVSQASYMAGTNDFLYVIDNWRKWLAFTIQYYRSLGELERGVADLEQALGLSLAEVGAP